MKIKSKFIISSLLLLITASSCSGSKPIVTSQTEQTEISLSWWGNDVRNEYTIKAVEEFEKLHPNIKIICNYSEWSGYQARNNVRMVSDTEADVMLINYAWLQQYSPDGDGYYDINKLSEYIDLSNFFDEALKSGTQNGKLNAVPIALNTQSVYINKTIYDEYNLDIPDTWDDLFISAKAMNGKHYPISMTSKSAWFYITAYAEQKTGKQFIDNNGNINFMPEDLEIMIDFYCRLINEKVMPQVEYFDRLNIDNGIYAGSVSWLSDASNYCGNAIKKGFEIVVANYTSIDSSKSGEGWYSKPATMYAISKNTEYPEESAMLLDFLLNSNENAELQKTEKGIPISISARTYLEENNMLEGLQYDAFLKMQEYEDKIIPVSPYFENEDMIDDFIESCNAVLYEKSGLSDSAEKLYQKLLNDYHT